MKPSELLNCDCFLRHGKLRVFLGQTSRTKDWNLTENVEKRSIFHDLVEKKPIEKLCHRK